MKYQKIFFDLDGTIIDSRERLYRLFVDITGADVSFEDYWTFKRGKNTNEKFLKDNLQWSVPAISAFNIEWMEKIESDRYLAYDKCFADTISSLQKLFSKVELNLVTARQFPEKVSSQLSELEILGFFSNVLVTEQKTSKSALIRTLPGTLFNSVIVGDTGEETLIGKELKISTANVLTGFRSKEILEPYNPDFIFTNLSAFTKHALTD